MTLGVNLGRDSGDATDAIAQRAVEAGRLGRPEVELTCAGTVQGVGLIARLDTGIRRPCAKEYGHRKTHDHHYHELERQPKDSHVV